MPVPAAFTPILPALIRRAETGGPSAAQPSPSIDLDHALRRAEEESIASICASEPRVAERHEEMASYYSIRALELIERDDQGSVAILQRTE